MFKKIFLELGIPIELSDNFYCEPIEISFRNLKWFHPKIKEICSWETNGFNEGVWAYDFHRFNIVNEQTKETIWMHVKSNMLDYVDENYQTIDDEIKSVILNFLMDYLITTLVEDTWIIDGEQFCFTKLGYEISDFILSDENSTFSYWSSPDCGICHEEDGTLSCHT